MGGLPDGAVIFLCILAAGAVVLIGFATIRHFTAQEETSNQDAYLEATGQNQETYMREVRLRNQEQMAASYGRGGGRKWQGFVGEAGV